MRSYSISQLFSHSFKWLGGGVGWLIGGPLGGVLGFVTGTVVESMLLKVNEAKAIGDFSNHLLGLIASVMKANMPVNDAELGLVKQFLKKNYGETLADEAFVHLNKIFKQNIPLNEACMKIRLNLNYAARLQLVQFLQLLAKVDGAITEVEQSILNSISAGLGVTVENKKSAAGAVILQQSAIIAAYNTLGVDSATNIFDIKKAYRQLAFQYHPDKVAHLSEEERTAANEKFLQLNHSYGIIKKNRNFS